MKSAVHSQIEAPAWTDTAVINAAVRLTEMYMDKVSLDHVLKNGWHFDDVYEKVLYPKFKIEMYDEHDLGSSPDGSELLGEYNVGENTAYFDNKISVESRDPRREFTRWHEVAGHGALQGEWLRKRLASTGIGGIIKTTEASLSPSAERRLERQANLFACRCAAPDWLVDWAVRKIFRPNRPFLYEKPGDYWLHPHGLGTKLYISSAWELQSWIGRKISAYFGGLSGEALGYRVSDLGWVNDRSGYRLSLKRAVPQRKPSFGAFGLSADLPSFDQLGRFAAQA